MMEIWRCDSVWRRLKVGSRQAHRLRRPPGPRVTGYRLSAMSYGLWARRLSRLLDSSTSRLAVSPSRRQQNTLRHFCLDVGQPCAGNDGMCCSGSCEGKKGKRTCRAHDAGTCVQGTPGICTAPDLSLSACNNSSTCACFRTTAGSNFCAELFGQDLSDCAGRQRDADCETLGFPPGTACAPVSEGECALLCASGMACLVPCGVEFAA